MLSRVTTCMNNYNATVGNWYKWRNAFNWTNALVRLMHCHEITPANQLENSRWQSRMHYVQYIVVTTYSLDAVQNMKSLNHVYLCIDLFTSDIRHLLFVLLLFPEGRWFLKIYFLHGKWRDVWINLEHVYSFNDAISFLRSIQLHPNWGLSRYAKYRATFHCENNLSWTATTALQALRSWHIAN